jgi:hypothetical protein
MIMIPYIDAIKPVPSVKQLSVHFRRVALELALKALKPIIHKGKLNHAN